MKKRKHVWLRILAAFLAIAMVVSYLATALTDIRIALDASDAASRYLVDSTEYVNAGQKERFAKLIHSFVGAEDIDDYYTKASIRIGSGKYEDALYYVDKCLELSSPVRYRETYIDVLTKKGCLLTLLNRNEEAIEALELALETEPTLSDAYLVLAQIYLNLNETDKLEKTLGDYLEIAPDDLDMRVTYMQTLAAEGKDEEATKQGMMVVEDANSTVEQRDDCYYTMALKSLQKEDFENALNSLEKVVDQSGKYNDLYYDKGICYLSMGDMEKAKDSFTESIDKKMSLQNCYYSRAVTEFAMEEADYQAAYLDLIAARDYEGEDRNEETVTMAEEFLEAAFVVQGNND